MPDRPPRPPLIRSTAQFARYVGLSRSAVSRVLNEQPGLRRSTIERVQRAIAETGFTPNAHARHLRGKATQVVGVCMENFLGPTAVAKLSALQAGLAAEGYATLAEMGTAGDYGRVIRHFLSLRVDGIAFIGHFERPELARRLAELARHGTPHVVVDNPGLAGVHAVSLDRAEAMRGVVDHLHALGHRRFGLLGLSGPFQTVVDRLHGIHEAVARHGLDPSRSVVSHDAEFERSGHFDYGRTLAARFAAERGRPTAYLAVNDDTAVGALLEFQERGLKVPEHLSLVGFNNQDLCLMTRPRITSVDQSIDRTMEAALRCLLSQASGRTARVRPRMRLIPARLVLRESTGPAR